MEFLPHVCVSIFFSFMLTIPCMFSSASPAPCEMEMSVEISSPQLLQNESMLDRTSNILYPPGTYWEQEDQEAKKYRGCPYKLDGKPCLRKCCLLGNDLQNRKCVTYTTTFVLNVTDKGNNFQEVEAIKHFSLIFGMLFCDNSTHTRMRLPMGDQSNNELYIDPTDGQLVNANGKQKYYDLDSYCMEYIEDIRPYHSLADVSKEKLEKDIRLTMYPISMGISITFLLLTMVVYGILPELRNLYGKCLMCLIFSLIFGYMFLSVSHLKVLSHTTCVATAFIIQFSFLSTFSWLNVMGLEIFFAFSGMPEMSGFIKEKERKKFIWYSLYAWSCPVLILIISVAMEFSPWIPDYKLKPRFAVTRCWFENKSEALIYFYVPQTVLVVCNIILFIATAFLIFIINKQSEVLRKEGCRPSIEQKENRHRFKLHLKLLLVMVVTWGINLNEWIGDDLDFSYRDVVDIAAVVQGVFIFLIFVWKDKILITLLEKFCPKYAEKRKQTAKSRRNLRVIGDRSSAVNNSTASSGFSTHVIETV